MKFGFSRPPFHECTMNVENPVKHQIYDIATAGKRSCKNGTIIIKRNRHATLSQIVADFSSGPPTSATTRTVQRASFWAFGVEGPLVYPC
ncbi:hypothetical protein TNCV_2103721 [Trichonephila clavipes]|nr:hypothetical protein TNCV_2103721 [Trichonephila clavipes]